MKRPKAKTVCCRNCERRMKPDFEMTRQTRQTEDGFESVRAYTGRIRGYGVDGVFCTRECGYRFGLRSARAGVVLESPDPARVMKPAKEGK